MNSSLARDLGEACLQLQPHPRACSTWSELTASMPGALLYHRDRWLELLRSAYGTNLWVATLARDGEICAGCILARSRVPFPRMTSLPFSDICPPLASDPLASATLMAELAANPPAGRMEVHGVSAPPPWRSVDCFEEWSVDVTRPLKAIESTMARNFRRNARRATEAGVRVERSESLEHMHRFYALQLETRRRLGVPPQPRKFFDLVHKIYSPTHDCEIWIASRGGSDLAGAVILRDDDVIYYKWSARGSNTVDGAAHLLALNAIEEFAGHARRLDFGRTDRRNDGLRRFKAEMGAEPAPLPYSYLPEPPREISAEVLNSPISRLTSTLLRHFPLPLARAFGAVFYRYLAC